MRVWMMEVLDPGNYAAPYLGPDTVEAFDSLRAAKDSFWRTVDSERIANERNHTALVFFYDPNDEDNGPGDPYPDRLLTVGPRLGIRVEHC